MVPIIRTRTGAHGESRVGSSSCPGDVTNKYYVVDGVEALQKFGQDAWSVAFLITTDKAGTELFAS